MHRDDRRRRELRGFAAVHRVAPRCQIGGFEVGIAERTRELTVRGRKRRAVGPLVLAVGEQAGDRRALRVGALDRGAELGGRRLAAVMIAVGRVVVVRLLGGARLFGVVVAITGEDERRGEGEAREGQGTNAWDGHGVIVAGRGRGRRRWSAKRA